METQRQKCFIKNQAMSLTGNFFLKPHHFFLTLSQCLLETEIDGLVLWCRGLSHPMQCQHPIRALVQAPIASFPIQLSDNVSGAEAKDDPNAWSPASHMGEPEF